MSIIYDYRVKPKIVYHAAEPYPGAWDFGDNVCRMPMPEVRKDYTAYLSVEEADRLFYANEEKDG